MDSHSETVLATAEETYRPPVRVQRSELWEVDTPRIDAARLAIRAELRRMENKK